jgi:hypothetical protein
MTPTQTPRTAQPAGVTIDPARLYTESDIAVELGWTANDLARARRRGLRHVELSRSVRLYRGTWILAWLEQEAIGGE